MSSSNPEPPIESKPATPTGDGTPSVDPRIFDRYECSACGYVYEPVKGDERSDIVAGIPFEDLPATWRCPVCSAGRRRFTNIGPVGSSIPFKDNLKYGFGVNALTPGQKNLLIFGSLMLGVIFFLSLYGLQ
jgi:rubredoxin